MLNVLLKRFWIVVVLFLMSFVLAIGIYEAGRRQGRD